MAKDDYYVLAYRLLAYLYACLKEGEKPDPEYFKAGTEKFPIGEEYWNYLFIHLCEDGYIEGIRITKRLQNMVSIRTCDIAITPKGIEFLQENTSMKKALQFLKEIKEAILGA